MGTLTQSQVRGPPVGTLPGGPPAGTLSGGPPHGAVSSRQPLAMSSAPNCFPAAAVAAPAPKPSALEQSGLKPRRARMHIRRPFAEVAHDIEAFKDHFIFAAAQAAG